MGEKGGEMKEYQKPELKKLDISITGMEGARVIWAIHNLFKAIKQEFKKLWGWFGWIILN